MLYERRTYDELYRVAANDSVPCRPIPYTYAHTTHTLMTAATTKSIISLIVDSFVSQFPRVCMRPFNDRCVASCFTFLPFFASTLAECRVDGGISCAVPVEIKWFLVTWRLKRTHIYLYSVFFALLSNHFRQMTCIEKVRKRYAKVKRAKYAKKTRVCVSLWMLVTWLSFGSPQRFFFPYLCCLFSSISRIKFTGIENATIWSVVEWTVRPLYCV